MPFIASQHDENVVYAVFNHHKYGDFKPYILKSNDKGTTWVAIASNLPERGSVYAIEEDHEDASLLFAGTEFGCFFSNDAGANWKQLKAGLPTVAVRDIAIQRRENDIVLGTFGRGIYILDDYSALRSIQKEQLDKDALIFATRDALQFEKSVPLGLPGKSFQGDSYYSADNLGPEAIFSYYIKSSHKSKKDQRREEEKKAAKDGEDNPYPSYEDLKNEREEATVKMYLTVLDDDGNIIKRINASTKKGLHRAKWDLRDNSKNPISFRKPSFYNPFAGKDVGSLVEPGTYQVRLDKVMDGKTTTIAGPQSFDVLPLDNSTLPVADKEEKIQFQQDVALLAAELQSTYRVMGEIDNQLKHVKAAIEKVEGPTDNLYAELKSVETKIKDIRMKIGGDNVARTLDMDVPYSIRSRIGSLRYEQSHSTTTPTKTHMEQYKIAKEELEPLVIAVNRIAKEDMMSLQKKLEALGAPFTPGSPIKLGKY